MARVYTPLAPFAVTSSPRWRLWRRVLARADGAFSRLAASRAALMQAPIRLSRWAYLCCLAVSLVLTSTAFTLIDVSALDREIRAESDALALQLDSMSTAVSAAFGDVAAGVESSCTEAQRMRLVRASLESAHARAFYMRAPDAVFWCGPMGPKMFYGAADLAGAAPTLNRRVNLVRASRLGVNTLVGARHASGQLVVAELDGRFVHSLTTVSAAARSAPLLDWDRALFSDAGIPVSRLGRRLAEAPGGVLFERRTSSPLHGVVLVQTVTVQHLLSRVLRKLPFLLVVVMLVAMIAGAVLNRLVLNRASPQHRLWLALRKRRFEPLVQPIVEVSTGNCVGGEVLMRWEHPVRGLLPPSEFILLAEETGMIVPMSDLVMIKARDRLAPLTATHPGLYFSFNIIPAQLRDPAFADRLDQIFDDASLRRENLLLELTEREFVDDSSSRALHALRKAGYRLAIDDFGTGHSSLATLESLPLDRLKIDREFVRTIDDDTVTRPVLDSIIALAHSLDIPMIAEGVETQTQWDYLAARGVQYVQGYLVARPMATKEFGRWLNARQGIAAVTTDEHELALGESTPGSNPAWGTSESDIAQRLSQIDPERLVAEMRGVAGIDVRDRMHALMRYPQCFVGSEAVEWLAEHLQVSRRSAVRVGQRLVALGHVRHVVDEHDFQDGHYFFCFSESATSIPPSADGMNLPEMSHVLRALRSSGGVSVRTRLRALVRYEECFSGKEACTWLMQHFNVSRAIAVWLGRELMKSGGLRHVFDDRPFGDNEELYRFL